MYTAFTFFFHTCASHLAALITFYLPLTHTKEMSIVYNSFLKNNNNNNNENEIIITNISSFGPSLTQTIILYHLHPGLG